MSARIIKLSPVLDKGKCCVESYDQPHFGNTGKRTLSIPRQTPSPGGDRCDIGAFEFGAIDTQDDHDFDGIPDNADDGPQHFNPSQNSVCLGSEPPIDELCVPIKATPGVAVICLEPNAVERNARMASKNDLRAIAF